MKKIVNNQQQFIILVGKIEALGFPLLITAEAAGDIRTLEQNNRLWAMLTDVSKQVIWHGKKLTPEDWKDVFTASLENLQVVPNLEGTGFVALGGKTSKMTKKRMSELIELIFAFGADNNVMWEDPEDVLTYINKKEKSE